jgi:hypothetical protein
MQHFTLKKRLYYYKRFQFGVIPLPVRTGLAIVSASPARDDIYVKAKKAC